MSNVEKADASNYKASRFKQRLLECFPELIFLTPTMCNKSEIVYACIVEASSMVESVVDLHSENSAIEREEDVSCTGSTPHSMMASENIGITLQDFYNVALFLGCELKGRNIKWFDSWPPTASDISFENVKNLVLPILFNFITWVLGFSDDPGQSSYIDVDEADKVKIFSVCQDLIHIFSHERVLQTPKSLSLAMAVRQMLWVPHVLYPY